MIESAFSWEMLDTVCHTRLSSSLSGTTQALHRCIQAKADRKKKRKTFFFRFSRDRSSYVSPPQQPRRSRERARQHTHTHRLEEVKINNVFFLYIYIYNTVGDGREKKKRRPLLPRGDTQATVFGSPFLCRTHHVVFPSPV